MPKLRDEFIEQARRIRDAGGLTYLSHDGENLLAEFDEIFYYVRKREPGGYHEMHPKDFDDLIKKFTVEGKS